MISTTRHIFAACPGVGPADAGAGGAPDRRAVDVDVDVDVENWMRPDPIERWRLLRPARI